VAAALALSLKCDENLKVYYTHYLQILNIFCKQESALLKHFMSYQSEIVKVWSVYSPKLSACQEYELRVILIPEVGIKFIYPAFHCYLPDPACGSYMQFCDCAQILFKRYQEFRYSEYMRHLSKTKLALTCGTQPVYNFV